MLNETQKASRIFEGYRALGLVTNHVPFVVRYIAKLDDLRIVTCVGRYFYSFNSKLRLLETSYAHKHNINVIASDSCHVFTACRNEIYAWRHGHKQLAFTYFGHESNVILLLPFGPHLISVDESSVLKIWEIRTAELFCELPFNNESFKITTIMHPNTFLNKIVIGSEQGQLQLWNIRTQKLIYSFKGWKSSVLCIEQSPACNVVAIGLANGKIIIHDLKQDETVMSFTQEWGPVIRLSFRTDDPNEYPFLVSSSSIGHIAIWNLEKRKLQSQMRDLHNGPITGCHFIEKEPLLITTSCDNAIRVWCFDQPDDSGRLLYQRDGHSAPPSRVRFHGIKGNWVLSAGLDSNFRCFSTYSERLNRNLGQASFNRKLAKKQGVKKEALKMPPIIEFTTDKHNIQSGIYRGSFGKDKAHDGPIQGVVSDLLNQVVVSGGIDGFIKFWRFKKGELLSSLKFESSVAQIIIHRENSLISVAFDDFCISVIDLETRRVIRQLRSHESRITDMTFSADARWLIVASMECSIRTWDLSYGQLVDHFLVATPCVSVSMSPTGEYLATTHVQDLGVYLWANLSIFKPLNLKPLSENFVPSLLDLPFVKVDEKSLEDENALEESAEDREPGIISDDDSMEIECEAKNSSELVTLSLLHSSRWKNLLHLDTIKKRNKPKEPFEKPKSAPFFIPVATGLEPKLDIPDHEKAKSTQSTPSQQIRSFSPLSPFCQLIIESSDKHNYTQVIESLKQMGPSAIDVEIRSLDTFLDTDSTAIENHSLLLYFMEALQQALETRKDFEFIQSCLGLFLKVHSSVIMSDSKLTEKCKVLCETVEKDWERLRLLFSESLCIVNYMKSVVL
ncbi:WD repeat-containing protein 36-like isoform X2 [Dinothrombium tinctorium]|uniref:WD repeat-containing protein 36-like isoform X2 n=1 Tax=Dinothrombium tinctorium TaxID=1965070 RepID=A0A443QYS8_9ACAR|nr:WD repeat-containing protein 36-like isoform X2 [Dinothrombium tinctorium]